MPFYFQKFNLSVVYSNYVDQIVDWIIKCNWFNNLLTVQLTQNQVNTDFLYDFHWLGPLMHFFLSFHFVTFFTSSAHFCTSLALLLNFFGIFCHFPCTFCTYLLLFDTAMALLWFFFSLSLLWHWIDIYFILFSTSLACFWHIFFRLILHWIGTALALFGISFIIFFLHFFGITLAYLSSSLALLNMYFFPNFPKV